MISLKDSGKFTEKEMARWSDILLDGIRKDIVKEMKASVKEMVLNARKFHRFKNRTMKAQNSIKGRVDVEDKIATLTFYIDPSNVTVKGYNRVWIQNDGSYGNYKIGKISPEARTVGGKAGTGVYHDDFMGGSWGYSFPMLDEKLVKIMGRMK